MIEARSIEKTYGTHRVLQKASLSVQRGQCVVLTGDNGSGKTTLLHVLVGVRQPDAGQVIWNDQAMSRASRRVWRRARERWGFLPQQVHLPPLATVSQVLTFHVRLRSASPQQAERWLERVGLAEARDKRVAQLSGGMRQRLGIALTFLSDPELVIMDEPGSSLDPAWRGELARWADRHAERGAAVLVTSQLHESWGPRSVQLHCASGRVQSRSHDSGDDS